MQGLSFREYLQLFQQIRVRPYSLEEILNHKAEIPEVKHPLPFFENYLKVGYYPFASEEDCDLRLQQIVNHTLETDLIYSLASNYSNIGTIKETFFLNQLRVKYEVIASPVTDFLVGDYSFEVGGKNKGLKQIQGLDKAFIVKDDIETGYLNTIPLWQFGLTY